MIAEPSLERRIVTVLFADLVGFTTLSEKYDAEDVAAIQDLYFAAVRQTIGRYGGRLEKFIGDAAMAVFGVPKARDDDAARAVRAGLALIHAVQQIGATLGLEEDALRLRVGINTGEAVTATSGEDEGRVTGDTVNTAARLQTAAPPGGVLIGETTALAVADVAELGPITHLELKGKAEPVAARLVEGFRAEPSRDEAMGALRAPTLGREHEIELLTQAAGRATQGAFELWLVIAPPGVGKSRLLREIGDRLAESADRLVVWRTRTRSDAVSPFEAVATLMRAAIGTTDPAAARQTLTAALTGSGSSEMRAEVVAEACLSVAWPSAAATVTRDARPAGDARPADDRDALFAAWLEGLDALASGAPQVWLVEDAHWAGGDVLAFIERASRPDASAKGRLVVATTRPSLLETHAAWITDEPDSGRHLLQLSTLASTDAHELVAALVGDALPHDLVDRIVERSDGNCLFIEELLRTWVSVGSLVRDDASGKWRLAVAADEIALPQSVQSIYAAQLDDLPPDARLLARRASVAGRRFPVGALAPLGAPGEAGLQPLRRRELVVGPQQEPLFGTAYAYRHALLRDAGYASLARAERARLHVRLARWLEQAAGEHAGEVAEQIAAHYAAAVESAPALAREIDEGLDRAAVQKLAADWYERAGKGTLALSAHDTARELLKRSIELTHESQKLDQARRWEELGDATAFAADMDEGAAAYAKAMELYRAAMNSARQGFNQGADAMAASGASLSTIATGLAKVSPQGGKGLARGARKLQAGAARLRRAGDEFGDTFGMARSGLARSAASLSTVDYQQLRFGEARDLAQSVLDEIGQEDKASVVRLLVAGARAALGVSGPTSEIEHSFERAAQLAHEVADPRLELIADAGLSELRTESGHGTSAEWQAVADKAMAVGNWAEAVSAAKVSIAYLLDDRAAEAFAPLEHGRDAAISHGFTEQAGWFDYLAAEAAFVSGDWDRAREAGGRAIALAEANAYLRLAVRTWHVLIPIAGVQGDRATLEHASRWYKSLDGKFEFPDSPYSRVIRTAQDVEMAASGLWPAYVPQVELLVASFGEDPTGPSWTAALDRVFRAWLEAGEVDGAAQALAALDDGVARLPDVSRLAFGTQQLLHGRLSLARGDRPAAAAEGQAALDHFRASNAPWWMAKAIRLVERAAAADSGLISEVVQIERRLGAVEPTK